MCQNQETGRRVLGMRGGESVRERMRQEKRPALILPGALSSEEAEDELSYFISDLGLAGGHKQLHALFECIEMMHFNWLQLFFPPSVIEGVGEFSAYCAWSFFCSGKTVCK